MAAKYILRTITLQEAKDKLEECGFSIGIQRIKAGIQQGVYPWGEVVHMSSDGYTVYAKLLEQWIVERSDKVENCAEQFDVNLMSEF